MSDEYGTEVLDPDEIEMYAEGRHTKHYHDRSQFRDPGGRSALRVGKRRFACPTCGKKGALSAADVRLGYQCDDCANAQERGY